MATNEKGERVVVGHSGKYQPWEPRFFEEIRQGEKEQK